MSLFASGHRPLNKAGAFVFEAKTGSVNYLQATSPGPMLRFSCLPQRALLWGNWKSQAVPLRNLRKHLCVFWLPAAFQPEE